MIWGSFNHNLEVRRRIWADGPGWYTDCRWEIDLVCKGFLSFPLQKMGPGIGVFRNLRKRINIVFFPYTFGCYFPLETKSQIAILKIDIFDELFLDGENPYCRIDE